MAILQSDLDEFEALWNSLTEKNKQHIRNGLGDNVLHTEEQARAVIAIMRFMKAIQVVEKKQRRKSWLYKN